MPSERGTREATLRKLTSAAALLCGVSALPAYAQVQQPSPPPAEAESAQASPTEIEEVVVTARRTDEAQQSVPVAVSTVTDERLETATVSSVADIQRLVPSLQVTQGPTGGLDFTVRGSFLGFGVDPSVITYIDEVPIDSRALVYGLYDLGSVQQLKGPQGTLFGRNSTGGAVLFSSKRPNPSEVGGYANVRVGNLDLLRVEGAFNVPLSDTLAFRASGQTEERGGFTQSVTFPGLDFDNRNNDSFRAALLWTPNDVVENYTQLTTYNVRERRGVQNPIALAGPCTGPTTPAASCLYQPPFNAFLGTDNLRAFVDRQLTLGRDDTVNSDPTRDEADRDSITNILTAQFDSFGFSNTLYYSSVDLLFEKDYDGTPARVVDAYRIDETETFYTESQLFGELFDERLDWRLGAVYSRDDGYSFGYQSVFPFPVSLVSPRTTISNTDFRSTAVFGQGTLDLSPLLEGLSLTAGYRYTWDDREISTQAFSGTPRSVCALQRLPVPTTGAVPYPQTDLASCTRTLDAKYEDSNYNLTLDWQVTDDVLVYAATRKGYKTGSFNVISVQPELAQYAPEVVRDVEFGLKSDFRIGPVPVRANVAAFRSEYKNIQTSLTIVDPTSGAVTAVTLNFDQVTGQSNKAEIEGFEIELTAIPVAGLELSAFYSKVKARYDRFFTVAPRLDLAGENVAGVTPETFGATTFYSVPIGGPFDSLDLVGSYFWRDAPLRNVASSLTVPPGRSYSQVDARLAFTNLFRSGADLAVFGKNLENNRDCPTNTVVSGEITDKCSEPAPTASRWSTASDRNGADRSLSAGSEVIFRCLVTRSTVDPPQASARQVERLSALAE